MARLWVCALAWSAVRGARAEASALDSCDDGPWLSADDARYLRARDAAASTRVLVEARLVATKSICVRAGKWFALGDDGAATVRASECGNASGARAKHAFQAPAGALVGPKEFRAVLPFAQRSVADQRQRWRLYKRCARPLRNGRPPLSEHAEFFAATPAQRAAADGAEWITAPLVLASDWLRNVGHGVRDVLLIGAVARRWCPARRGPVLYALLESRGALPWVRAAAAAAAAATGARRFDAAPRNATFCFDAVLQKAAQTVGDAHDARRLRDAALRSCGLAAAEPSGVLYVVHGHSREGSRALTNARAALAVMDAAARDFGGRLRVVDLGNRTFCEQVDLVYSARVVVGVFGAAIGANFVWGHDAAATLELTACAHSKAGAPGASPANLGHSFQPMAAALGKGYVTFCLCVGPDATDLAAKRSSARAGWFGSQKLSVDVHQLDTALRAILSENVDQAARAAIQSPCAHLQT